MENRVSSEAPSRNDPIPSSKPSVVRSWQKRQPRERSEDETSSVASSNSYVPRNSSVVVAPKVTASTKQYSTNYGSTTSTPHSPSVTESNSTIPEVPKHNVVQKKNVPKASPSVSEVQQSPTPSKFGSKYQPSPSYGRHQTPSYIGRTPPQKSSPVAKSPLINRSVSPQPRPSEGNMYRNILKPVRRDRDGDAKSTETTAYGGVIETPKSVKVSNLRASFDSRQNQPLMPMTSNDPRVRHSLPLTGGHSPSAGKWQSPRMGASPGQVVQARQNVIAQRSREPLPASGHVVDEPPLSSPVKTVNDLDEAVSLTSDTPSSPTRPAPSSPSRGGVAARYRAVTGRVTEEHVTAPSEQESASKTNSYVPERTQQYYKASWRVQTNDLGGDDDKLGAVVASAENPDSLSPRQTVLSSWNQKYQEQKQKTPFSHRVALDNQTTNEKDGDNKSDQGTVKDSLDISQLPVPVSARKSVVSAWHQRVQEQQVAATTYKKGSERVVVGANKSVLAAWQQRSQQQHDPVPFQSQRHTTLRVTTWIGRKSQRNLHEILVLMMALVQTTRTQMRQL